MKNTLYILVTILLFVILVIIIIRNQGSKYTSDSSSVRSPEENLVILEIKEFGGDENSVRLRFKSLFNQMEEHCLESKSKMSDVAYNIHTMLGKNGIRQSILDGCEDLNTIVPFYGKNSTSTLVNIATGYTVLRIKGNSRYDSITFMKSIARIVGKEATLDSSRDTSRSSGISAEPLRGLDNPYRTGKYIDQKTSISTGSDKKSDDNKANEPKEPEKPYKVTVSVKDKWGRSIDIIATSELEIVDMVKTKIVAAVNKMTFDSHYQRDIQVENVLSELSKTLTENQVEDLRIKIDWKL